MARRNFSSLKETPSVQCNQLYLYIAMVLQEEMGGLLFDK